MTVDINSSSSLEVVSVDPLGADLPLENWRVLSDESLDPNPFFGPSFLQALLKHMVSQNVRLVVVRDKDTGVWLMAAPVGHRRIGLAVPGQTIWTTDYSPLGTPLLHPGAGPEVVDLFVSAATGLSKLIAIPYLPLCTKTAERLLEVPGWNSLVAMPFERASHDAGVAGEAQLARAFSGKRRKEMRRLLRRLEDHGPVSMKHLTGEETREGFEAFLDLEARGWKGHGGTALLSQDETAAFSREVIKARSQQKSVRIDQLWTGETLIASLVSFLGGDQVFSWKIAFDEAFARYSPGSQIALMAMRENLQQPGFIRADSLAVSGHSMIEPLWRGRIELGTLLLAKGHSNSLRQRLSAADLHLESRLRATASGLKNRLLS
ncbi:MAG: GNAT family N-acetyltransferase [Roseibium sp.]